MTPSQAAAVRELAERPIHGAPTSAILANPEPHHDVQAPEVVYGPLRFERHELIAMACCVAIFVGTFLAIYLKTGVL